MTLRWIQIGGGQLAAAGAPGRGRLAEWREAGATDVITLQRGGEHAAWLPEACAALDLGWHHLPLSGRRLSRASDQETIDALPAALSLFDSDPPRRVVVHCAAGLHRTGVAVYLLLRHSGLSQEQAVAQIAQTRPLIVEELRKRTRKSGVLLELAEKRFTPV